MHSRLYLCGRLLVREASLQRRGLTVHDLFLSIAATTIMIDLQLLLYRRQYGQFVDTRQSVDARQHRVSRMGRLGPVGSSIKPPVSFNNAD